VYVTVVVQDVVTIAISGVVIVLGLLQGYCVAAVITAVVTVSYQKNLAITIAVTTTVATAANATDPVGATTHVTTLL
jgi:hypothetical protein